MSRFIAIAACVFMMPVAISAQGKSSAELAATIDRLIEAKWAGAQPAPPADDADFLRRLSLDLIGRIPRVSEVRAFLDDSASDKRARKIDELLASNAHVVSLGSYWKDALIPANTNQAFALQNPQLKSWLEKKVRDNAPYDKLAHEIIAGPSFFPFERVRPAVAMPAQPSPAATAFYQASEFKPENIAANISRQFLGVRLECAQCHDHPFASWKRKQFWELAAFFPPQPGQPRIINNKVEAPVPPKVGEIKIPNTEQIVQARFMDGSAATFGDQTIPRTLLADWVVSAKNPYFARNAVNRLWAHFYGYGLAEPMDDEPNDENPISHPELLNELAQQFVANNYDVKHLIRAFVATKTYQRSSLQTHPSQTDGRLWARMSVRGLSAEQMYDSLVVAVGFRPVGNPVQNPFVGPRVDFMNRFASQERKIEKQTSILQALMMMNGKFVNDATSLSAGNTLGAVIDSPFLTTPQKIETLFLATLSRMPRPDEMERFESYVARGGAMNDPNAALSDVFWTLLNTIEFAANR